MPEIVGTIFFVLDSPQILDSKVKSRSFGSAPDDRLVDAQVRVASLRMALVVGPARTGLRLR